MKKFHKIISVVLLFLLIAGSVSAASRFDLLQKINDVISRLDELLKDEDRLGSTIRSLPLFRPLDSTTATLRGTTLVNIRYPASTYFNYGDATSSAGYGFRDGSGTMQYKNSGGGWRSFSSLGDEDWFADGTDMYSSTTITQVGIGTTTPYYTLDVNGDLRVSATTTLATTSIILLEADNVSIGGTSINPFGVTLNQAYDAETGSDRIIDMGAERKDFIIKVDAGDEFILRDEGNNQDVLTILGGLSPSPGLKATNWFPYDTNTWDFGNSSLLWKDLYLAGNLTDNTNTLTVANAKTAYDYSQIGHLPLTGGIVTGTSTLATTSITQTQSNELVVFGETDLNLLTVTATSTLATTTLTQLEANEISVQLLTGIGTSTFATTVLTQLEGNEISVNLLTGISTTTLATTSLTQLQSNELVVFGESDLSLLTVTATTSLATTTITGLQVAGDLTVVGTSSAAHLTGKYRGTAIDISDYTNLTVGATGIELSDDDVALTSGYIIPLSASSTDWTTAFDWGDHSAAGYLPLSGGIVTGTLTVESTTTLATTTITQLQANELVVTGESVLNLLTVTVSSTLATTTLTQLQANEICLDTCESSWPAGGVGADEDWFQDGTTMYSSSTITKIGIGTTTPTEMLTVAGNVTPTNDSSYDLGSSSKYWANGYMDKVYLNTNAYLDGASEANDILIHAYKLEFQTDDSQYGAFVIRDAASNLRFQMSDYSDNFTFSWPVIIGGDVTTRDNLSAADSTYDLGSASVYWSGTYTDNLILQQGTMAATAADQTRLAGLDLTAGDAGLHIKTENDTEYLLASKMGIGTTTPDHLLTIYDATATSTLYITSGGAGLGGEIIIEDHDGGGCTRIKAQDGAIETEIAVCPTQ